MSNTSDLYEQDYGAWARRQIELLNEGSFADLDIGHLVEELEDMGRSERNELESRLTILLAHLLKWQFQYAALSERWKDFKGDSWRSTIIEQRDRIAKRLHKSPGLRPELDALADEAYADAIGLASKESGLPASAFPPECPYTLLQILDDGFFPKLEVPPRKP